MIEQRSELATARMRGLAMKQSAFAYDGVAPAGRAFADVAREIGVELRRPDSSQGRSIVLLEVTRLGETLCLRRRPSRSAQAIRGRPNRARPGDHVSLIAAEVAGARFSE